MARIVEKEVLSQNLKLFRITAPQIAKKRKAGQFIILRIREGGERIPLTIMDANIPAGTISLVVQEVGRTTKELGSLLVGDEISDVVGPLGQPTPIENFGTAVCIGGGVGTAVVYPIAKSLKESGNRVIAIVGGRTKELVILEKELQLICDQVLPSTDDGSYGMHGLVTDVLKQLFDKNEKIDAVFAIGPLPMMATVAEMTRPRVIKTTVSLNPIMVDGTGMCGGCRVTVGGETKFTCVDGPEFDGHQVDFAELRNRQKVYLLQEQGSLRKFEEERSCKIRTTKSEEARID